MDSIKIVFKKYCKLILKKIYLDMPVSSDFLDYVIDQLSDWGEINTKRMFGGAALYNDGLAFALVSNDVVYLKVDETNKELFIKHGSSPLKPFKSDAIVPSFYNVPDEIFEDSDKFIEWAEESLQIQRKRNKIKKPKRR